MRNGLDGKNMEVGAVAESLDGEHLLMGEAKWEDKTKVRSVINKLEEKTANFPKRAGRMIIPAAWFKQQMNTPEKHSVLTPVDVLSGLK